MVRLAMVIRADSSYVCYVVWATLRQWDYVVGFKINPAVGHFESPNFAVLTLARCTF